MAIALKNGSSGDDVKRLQAQLNSILKLNPPLNTDGKFGLKTERAVQAFQAQFNLGIDGIAGKKTLSALNAKLGGSPIQPPPPVPVLTAGNTQAPPWYLVADDERQHGVAETPGAQATPRILEYFQTTTYNTQSDETPWCSAFVNWALRQAGVQGTLSAAAASWIYWGVGTAPRTGAITVIRNASAANSSLSSSGNHVGFLVSDTPTSFILLGGNQNNRVKISHYPKSSWQLRACRWPTNA